MAYIYKAETDSTYKKLFGEADGLGDAPKDGTQYARKDGTWVPVAVGGSGDVEEAPEDSKLYGRKDATWEEIVINAGIADVADTKNYVRTQGSWVEEERLVFEQHTAAELETMRAAGQLVPGRFYVATDAYL